MRLHLPTDCFVEISPHSMGHIIYINNTIHMYSGITSGRVLNGESLCNIYKGVCGVFFPMAICDKFEKLTFRFSSSYLFSIKLFYNIDNHRMNIYI